MAESTTNTSDPQFDFPTEISRLWRAHNDAMKVIVRLEERFQGFEEKFDDERESRRPLSPIAVLLASITILTTLSAVFWLFIEVRVSPMEQAIGRIMVLDDKLLTNVQRLEDDLTSIARSEGATERELEWLKRGYESLESDRNVVGDDIASVRSRISSLEEHARSLESWVNDVDKGGSRKWIGRNEDK